MAISSKLAPLAMLLARGRGLFRLREDDLVQLALLRRADSDLVLLVIGLGVGVGDRVRLGKLGRRQREHRDLAVFRRAEQELALVEIFAQLLRRSAARCRRPAPRPSATILDAARLVLILVDRRQRRSSAHASRR